MADINTNNIKKLYLQGDTEINVLPVDKDGLQLSLNKDSCVQFLFGNTGLLVSYGTGEPNGETPGKIYIQI